MRYLSFSDAAYLLTWLRSDFFMSNIFEINTVADLTLQCIYRWAKSINKIGKFFGTLIITDDSFFLYFNVELTFYRSNHHTYSVRKVFLEISQNPQENTCAKDSLLKKKLWQRCFPVNFAKFLGKLFLHPWTTASVFRHSKVAFWNFSPINCSIDNTPFLFDLFDALAVATLGL